MNRTFCALLSLAVAAPLWSYSHFLHYGPNGEVIPERFDLNQLPLNTVTFYVSDAPPTVFAGNDSFPSVVNQIRQATAVWNGVTTSSLRVAFGGLFTIGTADNSPGGEVVFEEMPPGVLAFSGPSTCEDINPDTANPACISQTPGSSSTFLPILRSTMHINQDLSELPGPSFSETFFLVSVHEMGHALGLQHTFTSSVMSTIATRDTSLAEPIEDDDRAGISLLYPAAGFPGNFGSVTGRVTYSDDNSPVHMASVIALRANAPAVSALTLPDGTFEIDGLTSGQYYLYIQPLSPEADIRAPIDSNGNNVNPTRPFDAVAYPGTVRLLSAKTISVSAGQTTSGIDLTVTPRSDVPIWDIETYSYFYPAGEDPNAIHPAYLNGLASGGTIVATGPGLGSDTTLTPNLNIQAIGGTTSVRTVNPYGVTNGYTDVAIDVMFSNLGIRGPQDLLFSTPDYLYILPSALNIGDGPPPTISSVSPNGDGTVTVTGQNLVAGAQIYFDALAGTIQSADLTNQSLTLIPPAGASSQVATLTAYNPDGQSSMFLQSASPVTFAYGQATAPALTISPSVLPAAVEAMIDITGTNTNFVQGRTVVGFGTHDVVVRRTFVLSPTHAIVDVSIPAGAAQITTQVTALTDFQLVVAPQAFQIQAPQPGLPAAVPILFNAVPNQSGAFGGAIVTLYGSNLVDAAGDTPTVTFDGTPASLLYASANQINLTVPTTLSPGLATLLVNNGAASSYPTMVRIDPPEPVIAGLQNGSQTIDPASTLNAGQTIGVLLTGFASSGTTVDPSTVQISLGGISIPALSVAEVGSSGVFQVQFQISSSVPSGSQTLVVYQNGLSSTSLTVNIAGADTASPSGA